MSRWYDPQLKQDEQIRELQAMIPEHAQQIRQTSEQMQQTDARVDRPSFHGSNIWLELSPKYLTISNLMSAGWSALRVIPE